MPKSLSSIRIIALLCFTASAIAIWSTWAYHGKPYQGIDDANIFFNYADNLANGHGPTFGFCHTRVEGYTSTLWMLLSALAFWLHGNEMLLLIFSGIMLFTTLLLLTRLFRQRLNDPRDLIPWCILLLLISLSSPSFVTWTTITLMDTGVWTLIIMNLVFLLCQAAPHPLWLAMIIILCPLARPEAMLVVPSFFCIRWVLLIRTQKQILRELLIYGSAFAVSLTCLTLFRLWYFGYPLPNTFYAKVPPSLFYRLHEGFHYASAFFLSSRLACMTVIAGITLLFFSRCITLESLKKRPTKTLPAQIFAYTLILIMLPVLAGGDHFHMYRFMQPAWPFLCLLLVWLLVDLVGLLAVRFPTIKDLSSRICLLITLSVVWTIGPQFSWAHLQDGASPLLLEFHIARKSLETGAKLNQIFGTIEDKPSVGVIIAGGTARIYQGEVIDLMGLNNIAIAHNKGNRIGIRNHAAFEIPIFFQLAPDVLPVHPNDSFLRSALKFLFDSPDFYHGWTYGKLSSRDVPGCSLETFAKNSFIERNREILHFDQTLQRIPDGRWIPIRANLP